MQLEGIGREEHSLSASTSPVFSGGPKHLGLCFTKTKQAQLVLHYMYVSFLEVNKRSVLLWGFPLEALLAVLKHLFDSCG